MGTYSKHPVQLQLRQRTHTRAAYVVDFTAGDWSLVMAKLANTRDRVFAARARIGDRFVMPREKSAETLSTCWGVSGPFALTVYWKLSKADNYRKWIKVDIAMTGPKLFSADALSSYSEQVGMPVDTPQVQNMVDRMIAANVIMRRSHGVYAVADPFVRQAWQ